MPVRISINRTSITAKVQTAWNKGLALLSNEILNDCNQYCKEDTGALIQSSYIHSVLKEGKLIWKTPYAKRQYWEIRTAHTDVNPNASWKWCEVAKTRHLRQWQAQAEKAVRDNL